MKKKKLVVWLVVLAVISGILVIFQDDLITKPYHSYRASKVTLDKIEFDIKPETYQRIDSLRLDALKKQAVDESHRENFKANILYNGQKIKSKIRMKGDLMDHYENSPPSFRVRTNDKSLINATNKFSLQHFGARNFMPEWLFLKMLEGEDIISVNSDVVELVYNGESTICTFEEHFTHHLIDRFERPAGPIICISEEAFWNGGRLNDSTMLKEEQDMFRISPIRSFKYYAPLFAEDITKAENLINDYRKSLKKASEVFDLEKLAMHMAIADLTNTHHGLRWHNRRYYYNSETKKLEPIGFDGNCWGKTEQFALENEELGSYQWSGLSEDKEFLKLYFEALEQVSKEGYVDAFFKKYEEEIYEIENKIYNKNVFHKGDYSYLKENATWIRENLEGYRKKFNP